MIALRSIMRSIFVRLFRFVSARRFKSFGRNVYIYPGADISGEDRIEIGHDVVILDGCVIAVHKAISPGLVEQTLCIGDGSSIGRRNHIYALHRVELARKVLTASNVYISDCGHNFLDPFIPIIEQPIDALRPVSIGEGTWIGQGACIIGASVGKNCVIGANSVVLEDIPDYAVAVGAPARVVRRFDAKQSKWIASDNCELES